MPSRTRTSFCKVFNKCSRIFKDALKVLIFNCSRYTSRSMTFNKSDMHVKNRIQYMKNIEKNDEVCNNEFEVQHSLAFGIWKQS